MLPKIHRINKAEDFARVFKTGRKFHTPEATIIVTHNVTGVPRFGFIVSKKVGNSVVRHQVTRWLRETVREHITVDLPVDVVVVAKTDKDTIVPAVRKVLNRTFN